MDVQVLLFERALGDPELIAMASQEGSAARTDSFMTSRAVRLDQVALPFIKLASTTNTSPPTLVRPAHWRSRCHPRRGQGRTCSVRDLDSG